MSQDNLDELEKLSLTARINLNRAETRRANNYDLLRDEALAKINMELEAKYGAEITALSVEYNNAHNAVTAEKERLALAGNGAKYPIGTKLVEWKDYFASWALETNLKPSGRVGIVEPVTTATVHPENIQWGRARVGDFIIRILNKKGEPGKSYIELNNYRAQHWYPEGVDPSKE